MLHSIETEMMLRPASAAGTIRTALILAQEMLAAIESGKTFDAAVWHENLAQIEYAANVDSARSRAYRRQFVG